jgi:hypothetical protein
MKTIQTKLETLWKFQGAVNELGQEGANRLFRASLEGKRFAFPMAPVGRVDESVNTVGDSLGWRLLERAEKPEDNAFWANFAANALVIVADLNGPMAIWIPMKTKEAK